MSLVLWLPLIRDSANRGTSSVIMSGSPDSLNNTGKLGGCAFFDSSVSSTALYNSTTEFHYTDDTSFSYSMWLNHSWVDGHQYVFTVGRADTGGYGYGLCTVSANSCYFRYGSSYWEVSGIPKGTWTHIVFVKKGGSDIKIYINGSLAKQATFYGSHPTYVDSGGIGVGAFRYNTGTPANIYHYNGYINDFRIYNHALSIKEIKILNMAMVAHYPLDNNGASNENLLGDSHITLTKDYTEAAGNKDMFYTVPDFSKLTAGTTVTVSADIEMYNVASLNRVGVEPSFKNSDGTTFAYVGAWVNDTSDKKIRIHRQLTLSQNAVSVGQRGIYIQGATFNTGGYIKISNPKLEIGDQPTPWMPNPNDVIYTKSAFGNTREVDVSGYGYHGTVNSKSTMIYPSDTPKYHVCTKFDGNTNCIKIPLYDMLKGSTAEWSFSVWFYKSQLGSKGYQTILSGGFEFDARSNSDAVIWLYSWGNGKWAYEYNKWYYLTFVKTASDSKLYINGELILTGTSGSTVSSTFPGYIGSWQSTSNQNFDGKLSDFRIFAKALSANEVKELYETYSSINKDGNIYTYSFDERLKEVKYA